MMDTINLNIKNIYLSTIIGREMQRQWFPPEINTQVLFYTDQNYGNIIKFYWMHRCGHIPHTKTIRKVGNFHTNQHT